jgi:hypothetical protein
MIEIKSQQEIEKMRAAGKLAAETLLAVGEFIKPGITGLDIDRFVKEFTEKNGGTCAPYMYKNSYSEKHPFPGHVCISPNNVVCHGIPNNKPLDNTIFNVDITCILDGAHGDTSAMFFLGKVSDEDIFLMKTAQPAVVVEKRGIFEAMGQSFKLVVSYLGQIMFLLLLLLWVFEPLEFFCKVKRPGQRAQQMLKRDMFQKRIKDDNPISITEFMYPLMVGYDSVVLDVDVA